MGIKNCSEICEKAFNGEEALKAVIEDVEKNNWKYCSFDLILLDCNMPVMDGYEATEKIRAFIHSIGLPQPIISAVTGHTEQLYVQRSILCGMNQILSKPVSVKAIRFLASQLGYLDHQNMRRLKMREDDIEVIIDYVRKSTGSGSKLGIKSNI